MRIIKRTADNVVLYAGVDLTLEETGAAGAYTTTTREVVQTRTVHEVVQVPPSEESPGGGEFVRDYPVQEVVQETVTTAGWADASTTTANAVLVDGVTLPAPWIGGAYTHDDTHGFAVHDANVLAGAYPDAVALARAIEDRLDRELIDGVARAWGYSDSTRLASYYDSGNAQWRAEARGFVAWRDAVWEAAAAIQNAWQPGQPVPTYEQVLAALPTITRPQAPAPTPAPAPEPTPAPTPAPSPAPTPAP